MKENFLKQKRMEKNLTLEQVGNFVGVGKSTVRKWETGMIENMGRDKIVALSKVLDVSPLEILDIPETEETPFVVP
ncbi:XRE family transcriptional regulator, partial [Enterococcus faecalis]